MVTWLDRPPSFSWRNKNWKLYYFALLSLPLFNTTIKPVSFGYSTANSAKTQFCRNFVISSKENSQIYTKLSADHNSSYSCVGRGPTSEPIIRWNKSGFLASMITKLKENWDSGKRTSQEPPYQHCIAIESNLRVMPAKFCWVILK